MPASVLGGVSNFVVTLWFKQNAAMAAGANIGPRLFVLGAGTLSDTGATNSIGLKFQTSSQLYFQLGSITASATFATNLPAGAWLFVAAVYDGASVTLYQGSDTNAASPVGAAAAVTNVNFGSSGALYIGNRQDRQRSFDGWIDDFRFYTGSADASFVENVRLLAANPPTGLSATAGDRQVALTWSAATGAASYNVKRSTLNAGPYTTLPAGVQVGQTNFTDLTAVNGTTYYYVASPVNSAGEGINSLPTSALPNPPVSITIQLSGNSFTLRWPNGTLQSATNLSGPWNDVFGAAPPAYTATPAGARQFYRVNLQ
jgi:Concanavalin A-like lectin/glucanases superfamily